MHPRCGVLLPLVSTRVHHSNCVSTYIHSSVVIYLWDFETGTATSAVSVEAGRSPIVGHKDSIYSIAVNSTGSTLVSGSTENVRTSRFQCPPADEACRD